MEEITALCHATFVVLETTLLSIVMRSWCKEQWWKFGVYNSGYQGEKNAINEDNCSINNVTHALENMSMNAPSEAHAWLVDIGAANQLLSFPLSLIMVRVPTLLVMVHGWPSHMLDVLKYPLLLVSSFLITFFLSLPLKRT
jgi:hypothetical protein